MFSLFSDNTDEPFVCLATASLQTVQKDSTGGAVRWGRGTKRSVTADSAELHVHQETSGERAADVPGNSTGHYVWGPCCMVVEPTKDLPFAVRPRFLIFMHSSFFYTQRTCVLHCRRHYLSRMLTHTAWEGRYDHFPQQERFLILYCTCC